MSKRMNVKELTDQVYDTLMGNVGMSKNHIPLDFNKVTNQEVYANDGTIFLEIEGKVYTIKVLDGPEGHFNS